MQLNEKSVSERNIIIQRTSQGSPCPCTSLAGKEEQKPELLARRHKGYFDFSYAFRAY